MNISIEQARTLYTAADSVHDFDHILRVLNLAERIALAESADLSIVRAAALLHDWGRAEAEAQRRDHAAEAAQRARAFLQGEANPAWVEAVVHAIAAHRFRNLPDPQTLEAQVLFDADKLDAIGAIGVARAYAYGGAHQQRLWAPTEAVDVARWQAEGDDPDQHTPVHEFLVKLSRLKDRLYTRTGKAIAEERHAYMAEFFRRLDAEVRGEA
ncbi:MAG: HD domain-containing protein [Anaerolineae bacterium]|nr:HD domain-containing protein [Anaerolineae bacterium]